MPLKLDDLDVGIIKSLMKDGRKSFRQVSRETGASTPTVHARYRRLVRSGLIRGVVPDLDLAKLDQRESARIGKTGRRGRNRPAAGLGSGMNVSISCDYCKGQVLGKPSVLKMGTSERLFCCTSCRALYNEKYGSRMRKVL